MLKVMLSKIDFKYLVLSILCLSVSYMTISGTIDQYISFKDEWNAFGFCVMSLFGGVIFGLGIKK